jgi:hypothetical protein
MKILVSDWLLFKQIFSSETAWQNGAKLGSKHLCKILYKASSFGSIRPTNMATKINSFFNCPWQPYLLAEWDEMKKLYRGPYMDAFCQVWFHLVQLFQRSRLKYEKLTDGRQTPSDGNTSPLRRVSRYQRGNQNPYFEDQKEKSTKGQTMIYIKLKIE